MTAHARPPHANRCGHSGKALCGHVRAYSITGKHDASIHRHGTGSLAAQRTAPPFRLVHVAAVVLAGTQRSWQRVMNVERCAGPVLRRVSAIALAFHGEKLLRMMELWEISFPLTPVIVKSLQELNAPLHQCQAFVWRAWGTKAPSLRQRYRSIRSGPNARTAPPTVAYHPKKRRTNV